VFTEHRQGYTWKEEPISKCQVNVILASKILEMISAVFPYGIRFDRITKKARPKLAFSILRELISRLHL